MSAPITLVARRIDTMSGDPVRAVRVQDGVVTELGDPGHLSAVPNEQVVDLGDAFITPGWTDSHIHPIAGVGMTRGSDLSSCRTIGDVREALSDDLDRGGSDWILGWGLNPNVFGTESVSNGWLDQLVGDRPAALGMFDAHSMLASSSALERAAIDGARTFADSSQIVVDGAGRPTGYLLETMAINLVTAIIPELTFEQRAAAVRSNLQAMAETGFTAGQMLDFAEPDSLNLLRAIESNGDLPLKLRVSPWVQPGGGADQLEQIIDMQGQHGRRWWVDGVKLMIDGTIDNGTAWLREPDTLGQSTDSLWLHPAEYQGVLAQLHAARIPTTTHAIGDRGIDFVSRALAGLPSSAEETVQHRVEHIETLPDDVLETFVSGGIAASMQPTHCTHYVYADGSDNWSRRLGPERASRGFRTRDLADRGLLLALGSDWPVAPSDARAIAAEARSRRRFDIPEAEPIGSAQGLTAWQTLEGFTTHPWLSVGRRGGTLSVGSPADITAFGADPLHASAEAFSRCEVVLTMIEGVPVVDARGLFA